MARAEHLDFPQHHKREMLADEESASLLRDKHGGDRRAPLIVLEPSEMGGGSCCNTRNPLDHHRTILEEGRKWLVRIQKVIKRLPCVRIRSRRRRGIANNAFVALAFSKSNKIVLSGYSPVFELLESIAFFGLQASLVMYLTTEVHESNSDGATHVATWNGTCFLMPLLGAFVCDSTLGSYMTTFFAALVYVLGMMTITISAAFPSASSHSFTFYTGLYLVAVGSGCMKSSLLPLGVGQFDDENLHDADRKRAFFIFFYMCVTIGSLVSGTVIVWIQENVGWVTGYAISATCVTMGLLGFVLGRRFFEKRSPTGSPLRSVAQVVVAALRKVRLEVPINESLLHESDEDELKLIKLAHTQHFRFLDKAATLDLNDQLPINGNKDPWRLCTVTQVEELKLLLGVMPIWASSAVYSIAYSQLSTTIIEQGNAMGTIVLSVSIPPASIAAFEVLAVIFVAVIYENIVVPFARRCTGNPRGLDLLHRIGVGRALMVLAMVAVAFTEHARLKGMKKNRGTLNITWQLPACFLIGASEAMSLIGQLEFFYEEAPSRMKGLGTALHLLSIAVGSYMSSLLVDAVRVATTRHGSQGWIPEDLDEGHLDYYFLLLGGICALNLVVHVVVSKNHLLKKLRFQI